MSEQTEFERRAGLLPFAEQVPETLPFTVRVVDDSDGLERVVALRQSAYGRHVPEVARHLGAPEVHDHDPGSVVLIVESKLDGAALGTMRVQTNRFGPLWLEQSVQLPVWLHGQVLAEATRLGVSLGGVGRLAKTVLFKAYFLFCVQAGVDWMVIAGRAPLDRQYEALLFQEVFPGQGFQPMQHAGGILHRVLAFEVATAERRWRENRHPLYNFVFRTRHPDIVLGGDLIKMEASRGLLQTSLEG
ncbi:hypothetical protein IMZ29_12795 [Achromobacter sp. GG226]|uniref:hypothetical protein n=1 Tax=Verticiella alkaliphila TaxID=2779529 RepID=UPI001C0BB0C4|nr:hypothetical protein [Verticiella sp. GG226]MBU4611372.1 hypothetical protein [Verticiella sp. GG226]